MKDTLRIANCSGFFGDRRSAPRELLDGGDIDVLTGDYLAEITMLILAHQRSRDPSRGYASTFVSQMGEVLGECLDRGIKVVANAGGVNVDGCAKAIANVAAQAGLSPRIGTVQGDDLMPRLDALKNDGWSFPNSHTGAPLSELKAPVIAGNAYLGAWGIVEALSRGADIVVTGRVTDSALTLGPAAWNFGWAADDWDRLAAGIVAGHLIECSTQVTGGNFAFYSEIEQLHDIGMPIVEVEASGDFVVTKHPGTGGLVNVETVLAQLLYEIGAPAYLTPDVTAHFNSVTLCDDGKDRVAVRGAKGSPPPQHLKAILHYPAGFRNQVDVITGGVDAPRKAEAIEELFWRRAGGRDSFEETRVDRFVNAQGTHYLRLSARGSDPRKVGRAFSNAAVELALASVPGVTLGAPPKDASPCGGVWPTTVPRDRVTTTVTVDGETTDVDVPRVPTEPEAPARSAAPAPRATGRTRSVLLGELCGARSGDKGPDANIGFWARKPESFDWMRGALTEVWVRENLPEAFDGDIERYELPNVSAINFVLRGYLGDGAAASILLDSQAKLLGEQLRAVVVDAPA